MGLVQFGKFAKACKLTDKKRLPGKDCRGHFLAQQQCLTTVPYKVSGLL